VQCSLSWSQTIHNPGTAVDAGLAYPGPDITVVVESSYEEFVTKANQSGPTKALYDRTRTAYMLHSVPVDQVEQLTLALQEKAEYLFITSATADFYETFAPSWDLFVKAMAAPTPSAHATRD
jgi:hypothetical protein